MARMRVFMVLVLAIGRGRRARLRHLQLRAEVPRARRGVDSDPAGGRRRRRPRRRRRADAGDVRIIDWPASAVPADAIGDPKEVIGRGLVLPVIQNEPILPMKLASKEAGVGPAAGDSARAARRVGARQRGHRRRRLRAAGHARRRRRDGEPDRRRPRDMTSKVVLTNVQVLAAGTKIERDDTTRTSRCRSASSRCWSIPTRPSG